jgi:hypothetical protein
MNIHEEVERLFKREEERYQKENPCPVCGSHNTHIEINYINGPHMSGSEYCDDCGWVKETVS